MSDNNNVNKLKTDEPAAAASAVTAAVSADMAEKGKPVWQTPPKTFAVALSMQSKWFADPDDNGPSAPAAPPPAKGAQGEEADKEYENWQLTDEEWAQIAEAIQY